MRFLPGSLLLALAIGGVALLSLGRTGGFSVRAAPHPGGDAAMPLPASPTDPRSQPVAREEPDVPPPHAGDLFDGEEISRLLAFLLDPAHTAEEQVEARGLARDELFAIVERCGLPLLREAVRRMERPGDRRRAQLLLALAKDVPPELLEGLRASPDPLVFSYPDLRAEAGDARETAGDGGVLGDAPLLDVADEIRKRLWPDPEPREGTWTEEALPEWEGNIRHRLLAWWKEIRPEDRFLLAPDELLVVARDVAKTWLHHDWRFVALLRRAEGRWHVAGFYRPDTEGERVERVLVADLDGDGRREAAVWTTIVGGWTWGRLVVVGGGAPDGVVTRAVYGGAGHIRMIRPRGRVLFGVSDVHLPAATGHWGYLAGVVARECDLLAWTGTGFRSLGSVFLPLD